jgi:hypothetical protein
MARLAVLEVGHELEFIGGKRTCSRKPDHMAEVCPEIQEMLRLFQIKSTIPKDH